MNDWWGLLLRLFVTHFLSAVIASSLRSECLPLCHWRWLVWWSTVSYLDAVGSHTQTLPAQKYTPTHPLPLICAPTQSLRSHFLSDTVCIEIIWWLWEYFTGDLVSRPFLISVSKHDASLLSVGNSTKVMILFVTLDEIDPCGGTGALKQ